MPSAERVLTFKRRLLAWFEIEGRDFPWRQPESTVYIRLVTEVLLQQTRAEAVASLLPKFVRTFPDWESLADADDRKLQRALKPLGLWRRRTTGLKNLSKRVVGFQHSWPATREELEELPAVGQYVASAVLMFVHRRPEPLLDVNMARVIERYFGPRNLADIRDDPYLQLLARRIVRHREPETVNWAILDLGALICTARKPQCCICPLRRTCRYAQNSI